ncbi:nuclear transport factor 2 family protein [Nocardia pseudovaccinii]|uniref:nuclear transport factor 2 family protein n=1 Tax=Nocardia pseudovaccinii TaxID=189540 RepID=UPI003D947835
MLSDEREITNLMSRYSRALDDIDMDLLRSILREDFRFEGGGYLVEGRDEVIAMMAADLPRGGKHQYFNTEMSIDGDSASVDADWIWLDSSHAIAHAGRFTADFAKVGGNWLYARRWATITD